MIRYSLLGLVCCLAACGDMDSSELSELSPAAYPEAGGKADGHATNAPACVITMCLTGAMNHATPSNEAFRRICDDIRLEGVVQDCGPFGCNNTFDSFFQFPLLTVYPALVDALDSNDDGTVDDSDPVCDVHLIGFSWGGVNVLSIVHHLAQDRTIPDTHKSIARTVLLDPYQPLSRGRMHVPENIDAVLSMRHSIAPQQDCSKRSPLGPYVGFAPICSNAQTCVDYDYSAYPNTPHYLYDGGFAYGDQIGHCQVPNAAHEDVISFLSSP